MCQSACTDTFYAFISTEGGEANAGRCVRLLTAHTSRSQSIAFINDIFKMSPSIFFLYLFLVLFQEQLPSIPSEKEQLFSSLYVPIGQTLPLSLRSLICCILTVKNVSSFFLFHLFGQNIPTPMDLDLHTVGKKWIQSLARKSNV